MSCIIFDPAADYDLVYDPYQSTCLVYVFGTCGGGEDVVSFTVCAGITQSWEVER